MNPALQHRNVLHHVGRGAARTSFTLTGNPPCVAAFTQDACQLEATTNRAWLQGVMLKHQ